ncbi:MAG: bacterioferritin [Chloroflexota bacterium]
MKGNDKIIALLNDFLADELTAISQYMVHSEMCANWNYDKLHHAIEKRAIDEMKHAEKLIGRILFLEGQPVVSNLKKMDIGATVEEQLKHDLAAEAGAIKAYNDGIRLCLELGDNGSRELIDGNLKDEEDHLDWLEAQLDQINQMGLQNYLLGQLKE